MKRRALRPGPRGVGDDFYCWKFGVWYNLRDCVFRHGHATTQCCADCEQGAANLQMLGEVPDKPRWAALPGLAALAHRPTGG